MLSDEQVRAGLTELYATASLLAETRAKFAPLWAETLAACWPVGEGANP